MTYNECKTIKTKEEFIRAQIESNPNWVLRGLVAIWKKQTEDEQRRGATVHHNGVGFTGSDAEFLSKLAQRVDAGHSLSVKQFACVQRGMRKYAGQLRKIADKVI